MQWRVWSCGQDLSHVLDGDPGYADVRLLGHSGDVRREHEIWHVGELGCGVLSERFLSKDVERSATEPASAQSLGQGSLVNDAASRGIDDDSSGPHAPNCVSTDQTTGVGRQRDVEAYNIGFGEQGFQLAPLDGHGAEGVIRAYGSWATTR